MKNKILFLVFGFAVLASYAIAAEGTNYTLLQPLPGVFGQQPATQVDTFTTYLSRLIPFLIALAAIIAVVQIVIGGMQYAISNVPGIETSAKEKIWGAILGLLLALTSYLILNTINPDLVNLNLTVPPLPLSGSGSSGARVGGAAGLPGLPCTDPSQCTSGICASGICQ